MADPPPPLMSDVIYIKPTLYYIFVLIYITCLLIFFYSIQPVCTCSIQTSSYTNSLVWKKYGYLYLPNIIVLYRKIYSNYWLWGESYKSWKILYLHTYLFNGMTENTFFRSRLYILVWELIFETFSHGSWFPALVDIFERDRYSVELKIS